MAKKLKLNGIDEEVPILNEDGKIDSSQYESGVSQEEFDSLSNRVSILEASPEDIDMANHYQAIIDSTKKCNGSSSTGDFFTINAGDNGFDKDSTNWNFLNLLDFSEVSSTYFMFYNCTSLTKIVMKRLGVHTAGYECAYMFYGCTNLEDVVIEDGTPITLANMFYGCTNLKNVTLGVDTSRVSSVNSMFRDCVNLETLPMFDTSNVTDWLGMIWGCTKITKFPAYNTSSATSFFSTFYGCTSLINIELLDVSKNPSLSATFSNCTSLESVKFASSNVPTTYITTFTNVPSECIFYVPSALFEEWSTAQYWADVNVVAYDESEVL
ncbi:MAG: leucine-rich repeat protein [bacterium]